MLAAWRALPLARSFRPALPRMAATARRAPPAPLPPRHAPTARHARAFACSAMTADDAGAPPPAAECCCVYVTAPNRAAAKSLAASLVEARLAACVNIVPGVESVYHWEGKVEVDEELLLIAKTTRSRLAALTEKVNAEVRCARHGAGLVGTAAAIPMLASKPPALAPAWSPVRGQRQRSLHSLSHAHSLALRRSALGAAAPYAHLARASSTPTTCRKWWPYPSLAGAISTSAGSWTTSRRARGLPRTAAASVRRARSNAVRFFGSPEVLARQRTPAPARTRMRVELEAHCRPALPAHLFLPPSSRWSSAVALAPAPPSMPCPHPATMQRARRRPPRGERARERALLPRTSSRCCAVRRFRRRRHHRLQIRSTHAVCAVPTVRRCLSHELGRASAYERLTPQLFAIAWMALRYTAKSLPASSSSLAMPL